MTERGLVLPLLLLAAAAAAEVRVAGGGGETRVLLEQRLSDPCAPPETVLVGIPPGAEPSLRLAGGAAARGSTRIREPRRRPSSCWRWAASGASGWPASGSLGAGRAGPSAGWWPR